ncbi:MAG: ABC transporter permease, partial [Chloroflexales bacterium]
MGLVWQKIGRDLWFHRTQTLLALVAIGISVWMFMTLMFSRTLLVNNLTLAASSSLRPAAVLRVTGLQADQVAALQALPGVFYAGGARFDTFRLQFGDELWYDLRLQTRSDLHAAGQSSLSLVTGDWPAPTTADDPLPFSLALEESARTVSAMRVGATVRLYRDDMGERSVPVAGMIYDPTARPSRFLSNRLQGFATLEGLSALTGRKGYDWLSLRFTPGLSANEQEDALARVEAWLQRADIVYGRQPTAPDDLVLVRFSELALSVLTLLALLGCLLGAVWISSVMTTRMVRAQAEIGIMKAMGFQRSQIAALYMGQALCIGLIATAIALVASYASAQFLTYSVADWLFAKQITERAIPPALWAMGLGLGLLLPLVATSYPIWRGTAITVRQALRSERSTGFQPVRKPSPARSRYYQTDAPHLRYIGRNLLRHKGRLILSSATLSLAGMIFVTTSSLSASLDQGLVLMMNYWQADLRFETGIPLGAYLVRNEALALPGVAALEARLLQRNSVRQRPDGTTSPRSINLVGLPPTSPFLAPTLLAGRWLRDDDLNSVVID